MYVDSGSCVFEVKLKEAEGETDKRQADHPARDADRFTDAARQCLEEALRDAGLEPPDRMSPTLRTSLRRIEVRLSNPDGETASLREGVVLIETKCAARRPVVSPV